MSEAHNVATSARSRANRTVAFVCLAFFAGMIGVAYAAVPLYQIFCQVTGYGGTTQRVEQYSDTVLDQTIKVRFDGNVNGLPWDFAPVEREVELKIGETTQVSYTATNDFDVPTRGRATFNVAPALAGAYFNKVECFCFTDTELKPGETLDMPVVFFIDPAIVDVPEMKNVHTITLSYTFFPLEDEKPLAESAAGNNTNSNNSNLGG
ncbi:cytochrome c oxidase assembly protein [Mesorhizobium xinjiangense]|uniref:cytochrome c oxidase assembly protein n=1 Tax=Mesorhizobium xinjiangense TaxID=2678685 RepID=UPI0012EEDF7D|nr:cytochrome c oxidase assembly protein [Mesorhizobium xinjiangense]